MTRERLIQRVVGGIQWTYDGANRGSHMAIFGLGMGWSAAVCALRDEVITVTVVERDPDVLALHRELDIAAQLPPTAQARQVYFCGQDMEIARHAVAAGRESDDAGIATTIAAFGLPLIGPDYPDYAARLAVTSRTRMDDRWFPA